MGRPSEYSISDGIHLHDYVKNLCLARFSILLPPLVYFNEKSGHTGRSTELEQSPAKSWEGSVTFSQKVLWELNSANNLKELRNGSFTTELSNETTA